MSDDPDKAAPREGGDPQPPPKTDGKSFRPPNPSYTVRVICCVLFIFVTEICLAHYVYRLINSEMRADFLAKSDFRQHFLNELRGEGGRDEIARILRDLRVADDPGSNRRKRSATGHDFNHNHLSPPLGDEPYVEFVNPEMRRDFEARDEVIRRQTGKGAAPGGDSWVWITGSSRIPKKALEEYCKEVHHFCPGSKGAPGSIGPMGPPGTKGDRGDKGLPGIPGRDGMRGMPGVRGEKGERGDNGFPGLDGRDGVPGEPGLDGVPGRNGYDGRDGAKGQSGTAGLNGINGTDGRNGSPGPVGPPGMKGERGMPGPRGRSGKPGTHGTPGKPGISAYMYSKGINRIEDLLIPPSISSSSTEPMVVNEGENAKLSCLATGSPTPKITWMRLEKKPIDRGAWQELAVSGPTLNFPFIHRDHMGLYLCVADNGIPPQANHTVSLEVYFPPLVRISNQRVGYVEGANATLECETEAFPEPVRYWERSDGKLLEHGNKYKIDNTVEKDRYKFRMMLTITRANWADRNHTYYCVSKNEIQTTKGEFNLYIKDPNKPDVAGNPITFGKPAPNKTSEEDICGPVAECQQCPDTKEVKCSDFSLVDLISRWEVRKFVDSKVEYLGLPARSIDCVLYVVGKPVYIGTSEEMHNGCWMRDSHPPTDKDIERFWMTQETEASNAYNLLEYGNKTVFRKHIPSFNYTLKYPFQGNAHVIYNGSFFYHERGTTNVVKQVLNREKLLEAPEKLRIPLSAKYQSTRLPKLYSGHHNFMDFSVDDNGLWVIFPVPDSTNTAVMKIDVMSRREMQIQYAWNVSIPHHKVGEMFIVCGVLYAVDSVTEQNTRIRFALDLYTNKLLEVTGLNFSNPFRKTTMVGYNHRNRELYTWDKGNQLTYPVRYHDMGNNSTSKEETRTDFMDGPGTE